MVAQDLEAAAGARGTNSSADGESFERQTKTAYAASLLLHITTAAQLTAIIAYGDGLSISVSPTGREPAYGPGSAARSYESRPDFADTPGLAWHQRAGLEVLLDELAHRDAEQAERLAIVLYRLAAFAEARAEGGVQ